MSKEQLFFIAVVPSEPVLSEVNAFKNEISKRFGSSHALRSPPHITLFPPFKSGVELLSEIDIFLKSVTNETAPFVLGLDGFDVFSPKVIFVRPETSVALESLYHRVSMPLHRMASKRQQQP